MNPFEKDWTKPDDKPAPTKSATLCKCGHPRRHHHGAYTEDGLKHLFCLFPRTTSPCEPPGVEPTCDCQEFVPDDQQPGAPKPVWINAAELDENDQAIACETKEEAAARQPGGLCGAVGKTGAVCGLKRGHSGHHHPNGDKKDARFVDYYGAPQHYFTKFNGHDMTCRRCRISHNVFLEAPTTPCEASPDDATDAYRASGGRIPGTVTMYNIGDTYIADDTYIAKKKTLSASEFKEAFPWADPTLNPAVVVAPPTDDATTGKIKTMFSIYPKDADKPCEICDAKPGTRHYSPSHFVIADYNFEVTTRAEGTRRAEECVRRREADAASLSRNAENAERKQMARELNERVIAELAHELPRYRCPKGHQWSGTRGGSGGYCLECQAEWYKANFGQGIEQIQ